MEIVVRRQTTWQRLIIAQIYDAITNGLTHIERERDGLKAGSRFQFRLLFWVFAL